MPSSPVNAEIIDVVDSFILKLESAENLQELAEINKDVLGADGVLTRASKDIGKLEPEFRKSSGEKLSTARNKYLAVYNELESQLKVKQEEAETLKEEIDLSLIPNSVNLGSRHPLQVMQEDIADFFRSIGWGIAAGPEVEAAWYNFDALNFGKDHPARQMQDTFYAKQENLLLRTHTSPVQVRALLSAGAPLYIACPGRVFRTDELDATHTPVFHQCEGLAVDVGLNMSNLKGVIDEFAKAMFGPNAKTRLRPSYFPFTEPSAEMDVWFEKKKGGAGWIEWGGCGMVNPNVLKSCGIDPEVYSGFAFGMGIERTLMLKHSILDMHDIVEGDVRFSSQFGFRS